MCFFSLRILGIPKGVPFLGVMERVGNSLVEVYKKVVRYLKGLLIKKFRKVAPYCYIIVIY